MNKMRQFGEVRKLASGKYQARCRSLGRQLPPRRHADVHPQLFAGLQSAGRPVLQVPPPRARRSREIMEDLRDVAVRLSGEIGQMSQFEVVCDGSAITVLSFKMREDQPFTVFHVSDRLMMAGWQVPAYTMRGNASDVAVLRIVVREWFSMNLAGGLLDDLRSAVEHLIEYPPEPEPFSHT